MEGNKKEQDIVVEGIMSYNSSMKNNNISNNGILRAQNGMVANEIESTGILRVKKGIDAKKVDLTGIIRVHESIKCEDFKCVGLLKAQSITAEHVYIDGGCKTNLISCDTLNIKFQAKFHIGDIEASLVKITASKKRKRKYRKMHAKTITADTITIDHVQVEKVTGDTVIIGKKCVVDVVEYRSSISIDPSSTVKRKIQI